MKKFLIITAIVLITACMVGVLTACNSSIWADISVDYTPKIVVSSANASEVSGLVGTNMINEKRGILVLAGKYNATLGKTLYSVYNVELNRMIVTESPNEIKLYGNGNNAFYISYVKEAGSDVYTTSLYDSKGSEIKFFGADGTEVKVYMSKDEPAVTPVTLDIYTFADNYFRVPKNGDSVVCIGRKSSLINFNYNFNEQFNNNENYYYQFTGNRAYIFDKSLNLVTAHYVTGDYDNLNFYPLENGDVLVQKTILLMNEDKDYTYINNGKKYLMETYIVDAEDGEVSDKDFDYRIGFAATDSYIKQNFNITLDVENVAVLYPIEDKRLSMNANDGILVSLTNNLEVGDRFDQMVNGQTPGSFFSGINGYLRVDTPLGSKLVNTDGEEIGYISCDQYNDSLFKSGTKIYNFELKMLLDMQTEGYSFVSLMNNSVILSKGTNADKVYYRFDASMSAPKQISNATTSYHAINAYIYATSTVVNTKTVYTYYNEKDEVISSLPSDALIDEESSNQKKECAFFSASIYSVEQDAWVTHYYRVGK